MNQIICILKYKIITFFKINTDLRFITLLKNFSSSVIYVLFAIGAFLFSERVITFLLEKANIGLFLLHEFISIVFFIFFISINVGNIIVAYSTLYKSQEVSYLFTKPVEPSKIFFIKFLDNFFYSSSTLLLILISVLAGYANYFHVNIFTMAFLVLFNFVPFMFSAGSLGVIVLLLIIKAASKIGLRNVIYIIAGSYLIILFAFFNINSPVHLVNEVMRYYPDINRYFGDLIPPVMKFLPNNWLAESSYWIVQGQVSRTIPFFFEQITFSVILFSLAMFLGKKWYLQTWLMSFRIMKKQNSVSVLKQRHNDENDAVLISPFPDALLKKDFRAFLREPSQVIHFSVLMFLIFVFIVSSSGIYYIGIGNYIIQTGIFLSIFLFNILLVATLSLRFVFPLISLEGMVFWKIKSAPVSNIRYMFIKVLPFFILFLIIAVGLSYFSTTHIYRRLATTTIILSVISAITLIFINFGMGGIFAGFKEKNPIRIASSQGASITFLVSLVYMIFIIAVFFVPVNDFFLSRAIMTYYNTFELITAIAIITSVSFLISTIFCLVAIKALKRDF